MLNNKRGTIGATMTWVVATIIILVVVIIFVYAAGVLAGSEWAKNLFKIEGAVGVGKTSSAVDSEQMLLALLQTKINGESVQQILINEDYEKLGANLREILVRVPNCFESQYGGAWVFDYFPGKGKSVKSFNDIEKGKYTSNSKYSLVMDLQGRKFELHESCSSLLLKT